MPRPREQETEFTLISGKLNNRQKPMRLGKAALQNGVLSSLVIADNVDFDNNGETTQRSGRVLQEAGAQHSMWSHPKDDSIAYYVEDGVLYKLNADFTGNLVAPLSADTNGVFEVVNSEIVFTNGVDIGWVDGETFTPFNLTPIDEFETVMPPGQYMTFFRGVLYVASKDVLYASKPWQVEATDTRWNQFPMAGQIRMLAGVEDGLWISTDKELGFIQGKGTDEFEYDHKTDFVCPDGAFIVEVEESKESVTRHVTWVSQEGFCQGTDGGSYKNLSGNEVSLPDGSSGRVFRRFNNGIRQYVAVIHEPEYSRTYTQPDLSTNEKTI